MKDNVFPKFIMEGDELIIGKCTFHKQLATDVTKIKGGGWFKFDNLTNTFILHGTSHDFGTAKLSDIQAAIKNEKVFFNRRKNKSLTKMHNFTYLSEDGTKTIMK